MRILHLIDSLGHGGAEHQLVLNVLGLQKRGVENVVCHLHAPDYLGPSLRESGVRVCSLNVQGKYGWPAGIVRLARLMQQERPDIVHTSLFESEVVGGLAARLSRVPVVTTLVNVAYEPVRLVDDRNLNRAKMALTRNVTRWIYRTCCSHFIAISEYVKRSWMDDVGIPEGRVSVVYRGLPDSWFSPNGGGEAEVASLRKQLALDGAYPALLSVGRLRPQKGHRYLIAAMRRVVERCPSARLIIVGEGPLLGELQALRHELHLDDSVVFLGRRDDIREILGVCDIFLFPSLFEGLGVSLLEAMGAGKPCIASNVGPIPELVEDGVTGCLVAPQDTDGLAAAILSLASDPGKAKGMGTRAQAEVCRRFSIDTSVQQLMRTYEAILASKCQQAATK